MGEVGAGSHLHLAGEEGVDGLLVVRVEYSVLEEGEVGHQVPGSQASMVSVD